MSLNRRLSRSTSRTSPLLITTPTAVQSNPAISGTDTSPSRATSSTTMPLTVTTTMTSTLTTLGTSTRKSAATTFVSSLSRSPKAVLLCGLGYVLGQNAVAKFSDPLPKAQQLDSDSEAELSTDDLMPPPPPKHIPFPDVPQSSEMLNELLMFGYTALATSLQFLHLYRTVWWLPDSHTKYAMNFYLIDPYLAVFIYTLLARRILYSAIAKAVNVFCPRVCRRFVLVIVRFTFFFAILLLMATCCTVFFERNRWDVCYLCYPLPIYFVLFGFRLEPLLRTTFESRETTYLNGSPLHCCSTNPHAIRDEVNALKCDYNNRFKQVVFTTLTNAYYAGFIPCCFAQNYLYYDIYWATQHMAFLIFGGFTMCAMICFPANYCDVLHRASLHLGQWMRVDGTKYTMPTMRFTAELIWPAGALVRHEFVKYKSSGLATTAVPGNAVHQRFYAFFQNPAYLYCILAAVQASVIVLQLLVMYFVVEWHNTISLSFLILANYHTLFKTVRDLFVTQKIYAAESSIYDKLSAGITVN